MTEKLDPFSHETTHEGNTSKLFKIVIVSIILITLIMVVISVFRSATTTKHSYPFYDETLEQIEKILEEYENK